MFDRRASIGPFAKVVRGRVSDEVEDVRAHGAVARPLNGRTDAGRGRDRAHRAHVTNGGFPGVVELFRSEADDSEANERK